jgi:hypothetical protein
MAAEACSGSGAGEMIMDALPMKPVPADTRRTRQAWREILQSVFLDTQRGKDIPPMIRPLAAAYHDRVWVPDERLAGLHRVVTPPPPE